MTVPRVSEVMNRNLPLLSADQALAKAAEVMLGTDALGVVTADVKRRPMLVLTYRALVRAIARGAGVKERVSEHAVDEPVVATASMAVTEALELMREESVRFLPVVDHRGRIVGVLEPKDAARALWELLDYGEAEIGQSLRRLVSLPADASLRAAAKAMDENGVPEVLVKVGDEHRILRERDFLRAVAEGRVDEATVGEYARGKVIVVPPAFDAKAAVELMEANGVRRLIVEGEGGSARSVVTMSDLAFAAAKMLGEKRAKETAFILIRAEPGREAEIASKLILDDAVREVYTITGDHDILAILEAPTLRELRRTIEERVRTLPGIKSTNTIIGFRVVARKE